MPATAAQGGGDLAVYLDGHAELIEVGGGSGQIQGRLLYPGPWRGQARVTGLLYPVQPLPAPTAQPGNHGSRADPGLQGLRPGQHATLEVDEVNTLVW